MNLVIAGKKEEVLLSEATVLELLSRKERATIAEIAKATNWRNHSIRGFINKTVAKKMELAIPRRVNPASASTESSRIKRERPFWPKRRPHPPD